MIYTKNNPKLIESIYYFENKETFSGVVKDQYGDIAYYLNGKFHRGYRDWETGFHFSYVNIIQKIIILLT